jgi:5'-3' exonuclease
MDFAGPVAKAACDSYRRAAAASSSGRQLEGALTCAVAFLFWRLMRLYQEQNKLSLQRAQSESKIALAKFQAQAKEQASALKFKLQQQKIADDTAAAATAAALKKLHDASAAAEKHEKAALAAVQAADAAAIAHLKSEEEHKITDVRKAAAAASAAIALQSAAARKAAHALEDHVAKSKELFHSVNKAIDNAAKFHPVPGPIGPTGKKGGPIAFAPWR